MNFVDTIEVGTRIRAIREQNNLTLKELAQRTGLDVGQLSRIESNKVGARESTFRRIAAGLGVPAETFILKRQTEATKKCFSPSEISGTGSSRYDLDVDTDELRSSASHMRDEESTPYGNQIDDAFPICSLHLRPQTSHDYIIARENCRAALQAAQVVECHAGVTPRALIQLTLPIDPTAQGAGLLARHVRTMLGIGDAVCYDYFELLARHGIRTLELQLPDEVGSLALYESNLNQATIFISSGTSTQNTPERKIYSLVTELANILMENARKAGIIEKVPAAQLLSDEKFTRHFAALFLIPAESVQETMRLYRLTPERWTYDLMLSVKNRFGVSAQAFCYRLLELGHITEVLAADFRTRIEAHYEEVRRSNSHALTHSSIRAFLPFEPSPTDRAARLNAFLCDLTQLMPPESMDAPDSRAAMRMLKKLGCIEKEKSSDRKTLAPVIY
jgi:transcriptional regulator with XRE-family HTH domain/Zn-dependent peptidase ImmA (M78 family)